MADRSMRPVFILGCERSGSTWLGNIFDAHADVEFWMEPFADYAGRSTASEPFMSINFSSRLAGTNRCDA